MEKGKSGRKEGPKYNIAHPSVKLTFSFYNNAYIQLFLKCLFIGNRESGWQIQP
jgi:hypothetical protein